MKVTSAIFETMSGKLGGAVAARARGGIKYLRALVTPSNPRSTQQSAMRLILASLAAKWRGTLTAGQRDAWSALASPSESGIDVFCGNNSQVLLVPTKTAVLAAPASRSLSSTPLDTIVADHSAHTLSFHNTDFGDDLYVNFFVSLPQSASRGAQQFPFTYEGSINLDASATNSWDFGATSAWGVAPVGSVFYVRFVQVDTGTGKVATEQVVRVTIVA